MRTSLHDIHLPARRIFALLISVATLIATLPTAPARKRNLPGALDLATLPGTLNNNWYINLAYLNGTWVYKVGASDTQAPTTGTPFNGTITGTMPEVGRQFVIHPSTDSDTYSPRRSRQRQPTGADAERRRHNLKFQPALLYQGRRGTDPPDRGGEPDRDHERPHL